MTTSFKGNRRTAREEAPYWVGLWLECPGL